MAFDEWVKFLQSSTIPASLIGGEDAALDLACGGNLAIGLARCVLESKTGTEDDPYVVASFANYYCQRIHWAAAHLNRSEDAALALGAESLDAFRELTRVWYPRLVERRDRTRRFSSCGNWAEATGAS